MKSLITLIILIMTTLTGYCEQKRYAEVVDGIVVRVLVGDKSKELATKGSWIETKCDDKDINYAHIGYSYNEEKRNFISPKPKEDAILNEKCQWDIPIAEVKESSGTK